MNKSISVFLAPDGVGSMSAGHPAIWVDGTLDEPACQWLNMQVVPNSRSRNTWEAAARALVNWLEWCDALNLDWRDATRDDLAGYRDAYLGAISPHTGERYSPGTVRTRLAFIFSYFDYSFGQGWMLEPLVAERVGSLSRQAPIDEDALAHTRKGSSSLGRPNGLMPKGSADKVRVLSRRQLDLLLAWVGPRPSERTADSPGLARDRIVFDLGWAVGLRMSEKLGLTIYPFLAMTPDGSQPHHKVQVLGKGGRIRQVDVPVWLVEDIQAYIEGERKDDLRRRGRTAREAQLLLNASTSSARAGFPMTKGGVEKLMHRACCGAMLVEKRRKINPETGEESAEAAAMFSDHCLRHTYAVMTWHALRAAGHDESYRWKYIQHQLGHLKLATTMEIYLKHVSVWASPGKGMQLKGLS
ncbi:tyrosine-type recombinase/integrase [Poseidonocella sp. HB161398]|uniref:tyrosine-type recombinase/integrase n=1 Tax=Poseidonocella sp. HB161398 TaxID=2320855 RepID=UPI001107C540|nr:tyrosine-type recombinase/integrase [Poseidonocella sp. HB161398]